MPVPHCFNHVSMFGIHIVSNCSLFKEILQLISFYTWRLLCELLHNSHNMKLTIFSCTVQWLLVYVATREYTPLPAATRENPWDFPLATRWVPIPLHCMQSNCVFPIKHLRSLDLLDWTAESPQQHCHKTRRTLNHIKNAEDQRQILEKNQRGRIAIPITKQG